MGTKFDEIMDVIMPGIYKGFLIGIAGVLVGAFGAAWSEVAIRLFATLRSSMAPWTRESSPEVMCLLGTVVVSMLLGHISGFSETDHGKWIPPIAHGWKGWTSVTWFVACRDITGYLVANIMISENYAVLASIANAAALLGVCAVVQFKCTTRRMRRTTDRGE